MFVSSSQGPDSAQLVAAQPLDDSAEKQSQIIGVSNTGSTTPPLANEALYSTKLPVTALVPYWGDYIAFQGVTGGVYYQVHADSAGTANNAVSFEFLLSSTTNPSQIDHFIVYYQASNLARPEYFYFNRTETSSSAVVGMQGTCKYKAMNKTKE
ncbi:MAG: hypothetical protein M1834_001408 [Cirrosporium novae-zelandiae]|nr:MAG: hypothetical protein M1834_001408 [Cirrosporium novae-zelandiae]